MTTSGKEPQKNTVVKTVPTQPGRNGGTLQVGNPGNAGGSGRPPKAFLDHCEKYSTDETLWEDARKKNPNHVLELAAKYQHSLPAQQHKVDATVTFKAVKE